MALTVLCAGALKSTAQATHPDSPLTGAGFPSPSAGQVPIAPRFLRILSQSAAPTLLRARRADDEPLASESGEEAWLSARFGVPGSATCAAAAGRTLSATPGALLLRPVHLHAARDHLVLDSPAQLALSDSHATELFRSAAEWLAEEPVRLRYLSAGFWELSETDPATTGFARLQASSSTRARGRNIDWWLPRGDSSRAWRRLMNEVQMLWHTHPVNSEREEQGLKPVNALWLEGPVPDQLPRVFDHVTSDDPVILGLAHAAAARIGPTIHDPRFIERCMTDTSLLDAPFWRVAEAAGSDQVLEDGWRDFEDWFLQIAKSLGSAWLRGAEIILTGESSAHALRIPAGPAWRFWRRTAPLWWLEESAAPAA